jgi:UDP-N-acetyl-D-mannosaminuronate dehydrogenase
VVNDLPAPEQFDAIVMAVAHQEYASIDFAAWLDGAATLVFDANAVLSAQQLHAVAEAGSRVWAIGRGKVSRA